MAGEGFECADCEVNTFQEPVGISEYYMVLDPIWEEHGVGKGMLCIGCLENRMGRELTPADFNEYPVNYGIFKQSDRFKNRVYLTPIPE
jgi:hypothetical protein